MEIRFRLPGAPVRLLILAVSMSPIIATAQGVFPPHSIVEGKSLEEWAGTWWQWVYSIPADHHPLFDTTGEYCGAKQDQAVYFLGGTFGVSVVRDRCIAPAGKPIFFPIINQAFRAITCGSAEACCQESCRRVREIFDEQQNNIIECRIDGIPVLDLDSHLEESTSCFDVEFPENNIFNVIPGLQDNFCTAGIYLMLEPLPPGPHVIHFEGFRGNPSNPGFQLEVIYLLTVESSFRRGDAGGDGKVEISDAVAILEHLFLSGDLPGCPDAADAQDDGKIDITDSIYILEYLFLGGAPPPPPGPESCGSDPTADALPECATRAGC